MDESGLGLSVLEWFAHAATFQKVTHVDFGTAHERKERKATLAAKSSSYQFRKRGHLGRKAPLPEKKRVVSEDQEGCGQTSQQTSPERKEKEKIKYVGSETTPYID